MTGNIIGSPVDGFVKNEIDTRQQIFGSGLSSTKTPLMQSYLNNRTAWIKLASSITIQKKGVFRLPDGLDSSMLGDTLAKTAVLFNGLSFTRDKKLFDGTTTTINSRSGVNLNNTLINNNAYGFGGSENQGIVPMPGISNLNVTTKNNGSIQTAKIKITAYNRFQFELIELLYLRLGYTMLLEWGWDKRFVPAKFDENNDGVIDINDGYIEDIGNTFLEDSWFSDNIKTHSAALKKIQGYRETYNGNYDGFCGKVKNFSWGFSKDGSYDITIDLISLGDVVESLRANAPATEEDKKRIYQITKNLDSTLKEDSSLVAGAGNDKISNYLFSTLVNVGNESFFNSKSSPYFDISLGAKAAATVVGTQTNVSYPYDKIDGDYRYYVTFGELVRLIETLIVPNLNKSKQITFDIDEEKTIFHCKPLLFPNDPRICITNMLPHWALYYDYYGSYCHKPKWATNMKRSFTSIESGKASEREDFKTYFTYYKIYNLFINFNFIFDALKSNTDKQGNISIFKFFQKICDGINESFMNSPKLEPLIKEDKTITFIDRNATPNLKSYADKLGISTRETATFEVMGFDNRSKVKKGSFLQEVKFNTKITPKLANQIAIGATSTGTSLTESSTGLKNWNKGLVDRFQTDVTTDDETAVTAVTTEVVEVAGVTTTTTTNEETGESTSSTMTKYTGTNNRYKTSGGVAYETAETFPYKFIIPYETGPFRFKLNTSDFFNKEFGIVVTVDTAGKVLSVDRTPESIIGDGANTKLGKTYTSLHPKAGKKLAELRSILIEGATVSNILGAGSSANSGELRRLFNIALQAEFDVLFGVATTVTSGEEQNAVSDKGITLSVEEGYDAEADLNGDGMITTEERTARLALDDVEAKRTKEELSYASSNLATYMMILFGGKYGAVNVDSSKMRYFPMPSNAKFYKIGKSAYESYIVSEQESQYANSGIVSNSIGFIPLDFSLTADGLSGLKHFQKIKINQSFLPKNYGETLSFLVKGLSHKIDSSGWTTQINTLSIPQMEKQAAIPSPPPAPQEQSFSTDGDSSYVGTDIVYNPEITDPSSSLLKTITSGYSLIRTEKAIYKSGPKKGQEIPWQARHAKKIKRLTNGITDELIYFPEKTTKRAVIVHFTAGWSRGDNAKGSVKGMVNGDVSFPLGVHYFITMGGFIENVFHEDYWSNHCSVGDNDKGSIGIELQNLGYFNKKGNSYYRKGKPYLTPAKLAKYGGKGYEFGDTPSTTGTPSDYVYDFGSGRGFKGYQYYHKHSTKQIQALESLLKGIKQRHPAVNLKYNGPAMFPAKTPKNPSKPTAKGKFSIPGIYTHGSNYSKGDTYPDPNLVAMLKKLG